MIKDLFVAFVSLIMIFLAFFGLLNLAAQPIIPIGDLSEMNFSISDIEKREDGFKYRLVSDKVVIYLFTSEHHSIDDSFSLTKD
jgi:hypothetical protein